MTAIESVFCEALRSAGFDPIPQYQVDIYNIDLACIPERLAIEIDPGHWHSTPKHASEDAAKDAALTANGWRVVRFGGHRVATKNPGLREVADACVRTLL